ncbi:unnamed protein product, partial [Anisakis simplex]|uniref:VWFA domain-containing protein n=1 Tax=Anisakis simplex TaxID=6269 RepID=A0A0M3JCC4_ANISI
TARNNTTTVPVTTTTTTTATTTLSSPKPSPVSPSTTTPRPAPLSAVPPPCYNYFVFVLDASNGTKHFANETTTVLSVTKLWNLNGTGKLQVALMVTGLKDYLGVVYKLKFYKNKEWRNALQKLSSDLQFNMGGPTMSPQK